MSLVQDLHESEGLFNIEESKNYVTVGAKFNFKVEQIH